jgi:adenylate kinase family enzyme
MVILLPIGPSGCGKETQAKRMVALLEKAVNVEYIVISKLLGRDPIAKDYIDQGKLVPDEITNKVVKEALELARKNRKVVILDGAPRTVNQARSIEKWTSRNEASLHIINLGGFTDEIIKARLMSRGRPDDLDPNALNERLGWFDQHTKKAIRWLEGKTTTHRTILATRKTDGVEIQKTADEIWSEVKDCIPKDLREQVLSVA